MAHAKYQLFMKVEILKWSCRYDLFNPERKPKNLYRKLCTLLIGLMCLTTFFQIIAYMCFPSKYC